HAPGRLVLFTFSPLFSPFFVNASATPEGYTLSLHDALPICIEERSTMGIEAAIPTDNILTTQLRHVVNWARRSSMWPMPFATARSEEHTSELQSRENLVCRLLLEKKKHTRQIIFTSPGHPVI